MIDVGFTGTRRGLTKAVDYALRDVFSDLQGVMAHGCCAGADRQAHAIWRAAQRRIEPFRHPGDLSQYQWARNVWWRGEILFNVIPHLQRNKVIVDRCGVLVAAPGEAQGQLRSGTWSTIRYARRVGRPVIMVLPNGSVVREG